jgi:DNA invertase Pin-like site-specific DNA recombinase
MLIGYARVSSVGQSLDAQIEALTAAGCTKIYSEKRSGRSAADRPELLRALDQVREGDMFVVTRLDRLARSVGDLHMIAAELVAAGVDFKCLQQGGVDTSTSAGKLTLAILGAVAEFENDIRRERQRDGIERAKERGVYKGRPATIDTAMIRSLHAEGGRPAHIARQLGIGRASVYRALAD